MIPTIVKANYQIAKKKKIQGIRDSFVTAWYDLDYWFKKVHSEDQHLDAQDKGNIIVRFWRGIKWFGQFSRLFQAIKKIRHNDGSRRLFSRSYDLNNAVDYHQFETNLNWTLQGVEEMFSAAVVQWMYPTMVQLRVTYDKGMQKLWDRLLWWIIRQFTIGNNWFDVILNAAMWAVTIASWVVAGYTGGTSALATAGMWGARIANALRTVTKPLRDFLKLRGITKATKVGGVVRRVFSATRITRGLKKSSEFLRRHNVMMKARSARLTRFANNFRTSGKALKKKWYIRFIAKPVITLGVWGTILYGFDQQFIDLAQKQIYKRSRLMWRQVQAKYLIKAKMMGQTVVDLSGMISKSAQKIKAGLMEKPKRFDLQHLRNRTQQAHGMKAVPLDQKQFNKNPLIDGLLRLRLGFQSLLDFMEDAVGNSKKKLFSWNLAYHYKGADRWTFSMGAGQVGFALYNDGKRFAAQYLTKPGQNRLEGYTRRIVDKKLEHIYFYDNGYNKMIDSYYILGKYKQFRTILAVPEKPSEQQAKEIQAKTTDPNDLSAMQGMTIIKEANMGQMKNGIIDNMVYKIGKVLSGKLTPLNGSAFNGSINAIRGAIVSWSFYNKEDGSFIDVKMTETSDIISKKNKLLGNAGEIDEIIKCQKEIADYMMSSSMQFMQKIYPPSPETRAARQALRSQFTQTAIQLGVSTDTSKMDAYMVTFTNQEMDRFTKQLAQIQKQKQILKIMHAKAEDVKNRAEIAKTVAYYTGQASAAAAAAAILAATFGIGTVAAAAAWAAIFYAAKAIADEIYNQQMSKYNTMMTDHNARNNVNNTRYNALHAKVTSRGSRTFEDIAKG